MANRVNVGKNVFYTSFHRLFPAIITFLFWFLTARIAGPEVIGIASTITSIVIVISGFLMLDVYLGMKRHLGIAYSNQDLKQFRLVLVSSTLFVTLSSLVTLVLISIPDFRLMEIMGISREYVWVMVLIIPAYSFNTLFAEALITMLKSKSLINPMLIGTIVRFPVFLFFVFVLNYPSIGAVMAYFSLFFISTFFYGYELHTQLKQQSIHFRQIFKTTREILSGGLASWIPHIINVLGSQLSLITVFTIVGASEAGKFYLPMSIFTLTLFVVSGITRVIHPLLSGMDSKIKQTNLLTHANKMAFILTMPLAVSFFLYSENFLEIIGSEYTSGAVALVILMIGVPIAIITEMYYYYVYADGNKKMLLFLGLSGNLPRLFLYFILVPILGLNGSAIAYVIGTLCQLIATAICTKSYSWKVNYKQSAILSLIPLGIGTILLISDINFIAATIIIYLISFLVYIRMHYLTEKEFHLIIYSLLAEKHANKIYHPLNKIFRKIQ
jgi:O-antigen/teichoic acid export membrane protein